MKTMNVNKMKETVLNIVANRLFWIALGVLTLFVLIITVSDPYTSILPLGAVFLLIAVGMHIADNPNRYEKKTVFKLERLFDKITGEE